MVFDLFFYCVTVKTIYLEVSHGETRDSANQVAKLCGTELPKPITPRFRSDFSMAFKGFKLRFTKTGMAFGTKLSAITGWPKARPSLNASKIVLVVHSIDQNFQKFCYRMGWKEKDISSGSLRETSKISVFNTLESVEGMMAFTAYVSNILASLRPTVS